MSSKSAELEKFVMLKTLGKGDVVEVVEAIYRVTKGLVVLFLNQQIIISFVDSGDVELYRVSVIS